MGNAGHCTCGGGYLHSLRRADWQGGEEETQQKGIGCNRGCGICRGNSGDHSDRPDTDAALIRQEAFAMDKGRYSIIFSSLTGNTKILAETIRAVLPAENCDYYGVPETQELHSEILYIGFWTDKGNADNATLELLSKLRGKKVFLFGTAGFGADSVAVWHISRRSSITLSSLLTQAILWSENICVRVKCRSLYGIAI